jgi:hypothetical protein
MALLTQFAELLYDALFERALGLSVSRGLKSNPLEPLWCGGCGHTARWRLGALTFLAWYLAMIAASLANIVVVGAAIWLLTEDYDRAIAAGALSAAVAVSLVGGWAIHSLVRRAARRTAARIECEGCRKRWSPAEQFLGEQPPGTHRAPSMKSRLRHTGTIRP